MWYFPCIYLQWMTMSNVLWSPFLGSKVACKMQSKRDEASFIKSKTFRHYSRIVYWIQRLELNKLESQAKVQQWHQIKSLCLLSNINWKKIKINQQISSRWIQSLVYHLSIICFELMKVNKKLNNCRDLLRKDNAKKYFCTLWIKNWMETQQGNVL